MSQNSEEYLWGFVQQLEALYLLAQEQTATDGLINSSLKRYYDFIYGYDTYGFNNGVLLGKTVLPISQYISGIGAGTNYDSIIGVIDTDFNALCVNKQYIDHAYGQPAVSNGIVLVADKIISDNIYSYPQLTQLSPPSDLVNSICFCTVYYNTASKAITTQYLTGSTGAMILVEQDQPWAIGDADNEDFVKHAYNSDYFYQPDATNIDIARIVYRVADTTGDNQIYEYYLIDTRQVAGAYGLRQIDAISLIKPVYIALKATETLTTEAEALFSTLFDMDWGTSFEDYWADAGKSLDSTLTSLLAELAG